MKAIVERLVREPVLVTAFVGALLNLLVVFGIDLDQEQKTAILAVLNTVLAFIARSQVVPVVDVEDTPTQ